MVPFLFPTIPKNKLIFENGYSKAQKIVLAKFHQNTHLKIGFWLFVKGKNTEPNYFRGLANFYRLSNVKIVGKGATPKAIVNEAKHINSTEKTEYGDRYDQVFCVFDRDEHSDFNEAKDYANKGDYILGYTHSPLPLIS